LILTLTLIAGHDKSSVANLVENAGLTGFIAKSVNEATDGTRSWAVVSALVATLFVLAYQSSALLRSIRAVTALAWSLPVERVPKPTVDVPLPRVARGLHGCRHLRGRSAMRSGSHWISS
jgi:hypothetical protein